MKALGIDDSVTQCSCCGKSGLKSTVLVELDNGEVVNYGSVCATKNTGKSKSTISTEIKDHRKALVKSAKQELHSSGAYLAYVSKLKVRPTTLVGRVAFEFLKAEFIDYQQAAVELAKKYSVESYELC
jgi:hypothetical protein